MIFLLSATENMAPVDVLKNIGYVIVAILALMLMIIIHESGHYLAGKMLKFRIDEFSIGFGPAIFKKRNKKNGEVFSIRPIPIGGFCAFHGEDQEGEDAVNPYVNKDVASNGEKGILSYIIDDTDPVATNQSTASAQIADGKEGVLSYLNAQKKGPYFNDQPAWKRLIVLFSGAFFNFLSSILFITIMFTTFGQILPGVSETYAITGQEHAFQSGDVILAVDGKQVNILMPEDIASVFNTKEDSAVFKILRDGKVIEVNASKYSYIHTEIEKDEGGNEVIKTEERFDYGIASNEYTAVRVKLNFSLAFSRAFGYAFFVVFKILASLGALITGKIGLESAGGTITVVKTIADMSAQGFHAFMYTISIISANLAVMNLLPIPALDGSRMVFTFIEMIFRKPVPRKVEGIIHTVGLVILMLLVVFLDVFHLVNG